MVISYEIFTEVTRSRNHLRTNNTVANRKNNTVVNRKNNTVVNRKNSTVTNRKKNNTVANGKNNTAAKRKKNKKETMDCKMIDRKLRIEQHNPPPLKITRVNEGATVG